ncbi:MAG: ribosome small subunit-dependent GTPase A [SAR86 cluster bacterium]|uniref:Small ribosomal subunit biogenesis GTPase RsgA n=1 Tax=SAR86 cluster bacterium TaxID=2030880 RepID=A0A2A5C8M4_9GAMM|nr:ribosome small subunit-dependent GTPase A [Gammaproteobacteria bacterium AH-315-E17]PCJ40219.1 MAG: ribosome small subunit-dependent GTPase A [SAR86 cluster bacterium]
MVHIRQGFIVNHKTSLAKLGWQPFFQQQLLLEELGSSKPARIIEQHKTIIEVATETGIKILNITKTMPPFTVGDWILLDESEIFSRVLDRQSCFRRKAAGAKNSEQLIATNVDTAFIVCSLNQDFNLNRIERYLSLVYEAGAEPVIVLSKLDLCPEPENYKDQVQNLNSSLCVELINGLDSSSVSALHPWCQTGRTIVMLGSSGSGKSTLTNNLLGLEAQLTKAIREDDAKGRHTTTRRSLLAMQEGAMIIDTPGMREIQLSGYEDGVTEAFADIDALSKNCKFSDCQHESEPGCKVRNALQSGELDERRLNNFLKLSREQAFNAASISERRSTDKKTVRFHKKVVKESLKLKGR